jgi:phosphate-selective porin OprO/OprP
VGGIADYLLQTNLVGSSTNVIDEAYFDVNKYEPLGLKFGKFKQPYNLEEQTSSNNIDFMERSYINQNAPAKKLGMMLHGEFTGLTYAGSVFQWNDSANDMSTDKPSYAGRLTANLAEILGNKDMVMHVGLSGFDAEYSVLPTLSSNTSKDTDNSETRATVFGFKAGGQGYANAYRMQVGGSPCGVTTSTTSQNYNCASSTSAHVQSDALGLEAILAYGPYKIQGEYSTAYYRANPTSSTTDYVKADVDTAYISALWMVTGEKYADAYKKGAFGLVKPKNDFNWDDPTKGYGAIELGVRAEALSVTNTEIYGANGRFQGSNSIQTNDGNYCKVTGGITNGSSCGRGGVQTYTAQLKWILNPNTLVKLDYAHTAFDSPFNLLDATASTTNNKKISFENLIMMRTQFMF